MYGGGRTGVSVSDGVRVSDGVSVAASVGARDHDLLGGNNGDYSWLKSRRVHVNQP
jgi:hypothetical protein